MKKVKWVLLVVLLSAVLAACLVLRGMSLLGGCPRQSGNTESMEYTVSSSIAAPEFSVEPGAYQSPFELEITGGGKGLRIHYTLDGSIPKVTSPEYKEAIEIADRSGEPNVLADTPSLLFAPETDFKPGKINKCTVIRAACFDKKGNMSQTSTATYLVGLPETGVKTVSLSLDSAGLFDYENGIYVLGKAYDDWYESDPYARDTPSWETPGNYSQKGRDWERQVHADIIAADGTLLHSQELGMRIMGTASRTYYQKSLRLYARKEYGAKNVKCPLIDGLVRESDGQPLEKFRSFVLRNGGNDNQSCMLRDPFIQKLVAGCDLSTQGSEPCEVYIDGEYWGLYAITEDYSDDYIADNYDIEKKNVVMIKLGEVEEGEPEDIGLYDSLMKKKTEADFTDPEDYEWICNTIDIDNFIDYTIVNIYIDNNDGLYGDYGENNWRMWRSREPVEGNEYGDCRWRFMLYDTEYSLGLYDENPQYREDTLGVILERQGLGFTGLFKKLLGNDDFRQRFVARFMELRENVFAPEVSVPLLNDIADVYRPLMKEQVDRNGPVWAVYFGGAENFFDSNVDAVETYLRGRYDYSEEMLRTHFDVDAELAAYEEREAA